MSSNGSADENEAFTYLPSDEVAAIGRAQAERWREALDLMAEGPTGQQDGGLPCRVHASSRISSPLSGLAATEETAE